MKWPEDLAEREGSINLLEFYSPAFPIDVLCTGNKGDSAVHLRLDNTAAVGCWNRYRCKHGLGQEILTQVIDDNTGILQITAEHVKGEINDADSLSRWEEEGEQQIWSDFNASVGNWYIHDISSQVQQSMGNLGDPISCCTGVSSATRGVTLNARLAGQLRHHGPIHPAHGERPL